MLGGKLPVHPYLKKLETVKDVWSIFTPLSKKCESINLGQGFPNFSPPKFLMDSIKDCLDVALNHQYVPPRGVPALLESLSRLLSPSYNRKLDASSEIMITQGANQALLVIFQTYLRPGDVVLVLAPFFDIYEPLVVTTGASLISIPYDCDEEALLDLQNSKDDSQSNGTFVTAERLFQFPLEKVRNIVNRVGKEKCKFLLLNSPHNPSGKCWSETETQTISDFIKNETEMFVINDEVYEQLVFDGGKHYHLANRLWERCFTIGSIGKTFGVTGWRIGWVIAPPKRISDLVAMQARTVFCTNSLLQYASAKGIDHCLQTSSNFLDQQMTDYTARRDALCSGLEAAGIPYVKPQGAYFVLAYTKKFHQNVREWAIENPSLVDKSEPWDFTVARYLTHVKKVTGIPPSAFFPSDNTFNDTDQKSPFYSDFIRFCFCKDLETIKEATKRLAEP